MKRLLIFLMLLGALPLFGQCVRRDDTVQNAMGQALSGVSVYYLSQPANTTALTPLAAAYSDSGCTIPQNPAITDGHGHAFAYINASIFTVVYKLDPSHQLVYPDQEPLGAGVTPNLDAPGPIGNVTPNTAKFTSVTDTGLPDGCVKSVSGLLQTISCGLADLTSPGPIGGTTPSSATFTDIKSKTSPMVDIRAYGAVIDGVTDIGPALASAVAAACTNSATVYIPCGNSACYLADGVNWFSGSSCQGQKETFKLAGQLRVGTTFVTPNDSHLICDGGYTAGGFVAGGPNCNITAPTAYGTLGTDISSGSQSFTPTFTGGSIANTIVGSSISVIDPISCAITGTITRTSASTKNVTATVATPCRIPPGSLATLSGATDSTFNGSFMVIAIDYATGAITWTQTGASAATTTGGSVASYNDDTFETVRITAAAGGTLTATFAHAHSASAKWGAVGVAPLHDTYLAHEFRGLSVSNNYGAAFSAQHNSEVLLLGVHFSAKAWPSSIAAELASAINWRIGGSELDTYAQYQCAWNCTQNSYPFGLRLTSQTGTQDSTGLGTVNDRTFVLGGIKIDTNGLGGLNSFMGSLHFQDVIVEQAAGYGLLIDPRQSSGGYPNTLDNLFLQDNFLSFDDCLVGYTDASNGGGIIVNSLNGLTVNNCLTNSKFGGAVTVNGVHTMGATIPHKGFVNDGLSFEGEYRSGGADFHPSLVPHATKTVNTDPTTWTCGTGCPVTTGILAPNGSTNAAEIGNTDGGASHSVTVYSASLTVATKDWFISGVWAMPGTGYTKPTSQASPFRTFNVTAGNSAVTFDGGSNAYFYSDSAGYESNWYNDFWHPVVTANKVTGAGGTGSITMALRGPSTNGYGTRFYMPFLIHIPYSEKPSTMTDAQWDAEILRWRESLMHGYVPAGLPAAALAISPSLKMYWGSDTNLYRSAAGVVKTDGWFDAGTGIKCAGSAGGTGQLLSTTGSGCQWIDPTSSTPGGTTGAIQYNNGSGFGGAVMNKIVKGNGTAAPTEAGASDVVGLFNGGTCSGYLKSDGTCDTPSSGGSIAGVAIVGASGDTTGAADVTALNAAITTCVANNGTIQLTAATYYVNAGLTAISSPCSIRGAGVGQTVIQNTSATAQVFTVNYETAGGWTSQTQGMTISDLSINQKTGVTPTAGGAFKVGSASGAGYYLADLHIERIHMNNVYRCFDVETGTISDWITDSYCNHAVAGASGGLLYNDATPGGDWHFDALEFNGSGSGITIAQSDVMEFTNLKTNGIGVVFTQAGTTQYVRFLNPSIESTGSGNGQCGFDFGTGSHSPTAVQIWGGQIDLIQTALCNTANATSLFYAYDEHVTAAHTSTNSVWVSNVGGSSSGSTTILSQYNALGIDTFVSAGTVALTSHTSDTLQSWTNGIGNGDTGTLNVTSSNTVTAVTSSADAYLNVTPSSPSWSLQANCTPGAAGQVCKLGKYVSSNTFYEIVFIQGTGLQWYKVVSGSASTIGSVYNPTWAVGSTNNVKAAFNYSGGVMYLTGYLNGAAISTLTVSDSSSPLSANGQPFIGMTNNAGTYMSALLVQSYPDPNTYQTVVNCSTSGSVTFEQPRVGITDKQVKAYENACNGTASYTFPIAFTNTPQVLSQSLAATATSVSTTAVTITGSTSTGYVMLDGF